MAILNVFLSYGLVFVVFSAAIVIAVMIGITAAKKKKEPEVPDDGSAEK
ncbi:MAG: hypothetical protein IK115_06095 [Lachnospiraceae bacterium]|nr:hypothetical protein [Lachnospiraceae bacterium]